MPDAVLSRPASPRGSTRWAIYGILLAVTLAGIRIAEEPDNQSAAQPQRYPTADALPAELTRIPELELERLARRPQRETDADPFNARSWKAFASDEPRRDTPPPPPQAPPLPFTFMGKLVDEGGIVVFLTNGARNWIVRAGDTIEGLYRVEVIGDERMTLTYLALQTPQELAIGEKTTLPEAEARAATSTAEALLPVDSPRASTALPGAVPLLFAAPARVVAGNELIVSVGLPPGGDARHARVVLAFDPNVLAAIGAPSRRPWARDNPARRRRRAVGAAAVSGDRAAADDHADRHRRGHFNGFAGRKSAACDARRTQRRDRAGGRVSSWQISHTQISCTAPGSAPPANRSLWTLPAPASASRPRNRGSLSSSADSRPSPG